jgi:hypothetical protein
MAFTLSEALVSTFLDHILVLVMTASLLDKEILRSLSQVSHVDLVKASGTLEISNGCNLYVYLCTYIIYVELLNVIYWLYGHML